MIRKLLFGITVAAALGVAGCGTYGPTPYQPGGKGAQGYSETKIETNRYRISFKGNSLTDKDTVENYMLYRAAELTLQNGYDVFTVAQRDTDKKSRTREYGGFDSGFIRYSYFYPGYGWFYDYDPFWTAPRYEQVTQYQAYAEIVMGKGPKGSDPNSFDARDVEKNLGPLITRPPR
ncbi:MAG: hypothetical protein GC155_05410 [Alphaproteobacteria bacterium]|nr:hypothetical protein [Alphaproteobacteria bacterium]